MKNIRRKEKAIKSDEEMISILTGARYINVAMCVDNEPYLVTLSHGYDQKQNCIYFHCAGEGKKLDILKANPIVWGQAMDDQGYVQGKCDHLYATVQFRGEVQFVEDEVEKRHGLAVMIEALEDVPEIVKEKQLTENAVRRVTIGRIDVEFFTGKQANKVIVQG